MSGNIISLANGLIFAMIVLLFVPVLMVWIAFRG